jgi:major membrane immunogen (membrane-anchored lipoprotein)
MKRSGPLLTLLAGLLLALFMLSVNATTGTRSASTGSESPADAVSPSPAPTSTATATATATPGKPSPSPGPSKSTTVPDGDYAGRTDDDSSAVAVTLRDGRAVAYFCDGRNQESWLKGDVEADGNMRLTGSKDKDQVLTGQLTGKRIRGTVDMGQRKYGFTADKAVKPSGLYRATATVRGAKVDGGWIVLRDGRQVGILKRDGKAAPAPRIDPETGAVTVDGKHLTARPVTP